jgi:hypothetical protein
MRRTRRLTSLGAFFRQPANRVPVFVSHLSRREPGPVEFSETRFLETKTTQAVAEQLVSKEVAKVDAVSLRENVFRKSEILRFGLMD